jgi:hypothetical protein
LHPVIPNVAFIGNTEPRTPLARVLDCSGGMEAMPPQARTHAVASGDRTPVLALRAEQRTGRAGC